MSKKHYINVRGCNGSGKTTLLRLFAERYPDAEVKKVEVSDHAPISYTDLGQGIAILGDYTRASYDCTTAGCDRIKTQKAVKEALINIPADIVLFEGIIVSTIFQPWSDWSKDNGGMTWAFLDTPLKLCLERIHYRNGGKPIKEQLVEDKFNGINRIKDKAEDAGERVITINHLDPVKDLVGIVNDVA